MLDFKHGLLDIKHGLHDFKHGLFDFKHRLLYLKHWMLDFRHGFLDIKHGLIDYKHGLSNFSGEISNVAEIIIVSLTFWKNLPLKMAENGSTATRKRMCNVRILNWGLFGVPYVWEVHRTFCLQRTFLDLLIAILWPR